jgi:transposase-like protein
MKRYTPQIKQLALHAIKANDGDVALTSAKTGIPRSTLYDWLREQARQPDKKNRADSRHNSLELADSVDEQFNLLRTRMMTEAMRIANSLAEESDGISLNQRVIALSRLLDRIMILDARKPVDEPHYIVIDYMDFEEPPDDEDDIIEEDSLDS